MQNSHIRMDLPLVVGITGGIASGKSTVRSMFQDLGVPCVDIDLVVRSIHQDPTHPACQLLSKQFPSWVDVEGRLLRGSLREYFSVNPSANRKLIEILKPYVVEALWSWTLQQTGAYVMWESALLVQEDILDCVACTMNKSKFRQRILWVSSDPSLQFDRLVKRQVAWSFEDATRMLEMQTNEMTFANMADDILVNNSDLVSLAVAVRSLHSAYNRYGEIV